MPRPSPTLERLIAGAALCLAFLMMASVFAPDLTRADQDPIDEQTQSTDPHEGLTSLGTIEDDRYLIKVFGGPQGPLYSIYDAHDQRELSVLLTGDEVKEWYPDLPIPDMEFGMDGALMMADPEYPH